MTRFPPFAALRISLIGVIGFAMLAIAPQPAARADMPPVQTLMNDGAWAPMPLPAGPERQEAQAGFYDAARSRLLVFGGWNGTASLNTTWVLALTGPPTWTQLTTVGALPPGRYAHTLVYDSTRDRILVFGGRDNVNSFGDVWALTLSGTPTWTQLAPLGSLPSGRFGQDAIYDPVRDRMILFGGYDGAFKNDLWELSLAGSPTWTQLSPVGSAPSPRDFSTSIYDPVGDRLVLFGGNSGSPRSDTWSLSLAGTPTWVQLAPAGTVPAARLLHKSFYDSVRNRLVIVGGYDGANMRSDVAALTLAGTPTWSLLAPDGPAIYRRSDHTVVYDSAADRGIVFGGRDLYHFFDDVWELRLSGTPAWKPLAGSPPARLLHKTALDSSRNQMLMFGGYANGQDWLDDLWALHLGVGSAWERLDVAPGISRPARRSDHVGVVDPSGDRYILFGGRDQNSFFNDTWAFDLSARTWAPLATSGTPPSPREAMGAIYDPLRDRLILVGGWNGAVSLNEVWALTLDASPTWTQLSPGGTPPPGRYAHNLVYDPVRDRVVLFGGYNGFNYFNDAWALNLSGPPVWTNLSPAGTLPSRRIGPESIYDPLRDRLIVFGGYDGGFHNDVHALALASPAWTLLSPTGPAPLARDFTSGVYHPMLDRLVIFGGNTNRLSPLRPAIGLGDTWTLSWGQIPTPTRIGFAEEEVLPGTAKITWFTPDGAGQTAVAYRREATSDWQSLGPLSSDASGRIVLVDRVPAGGRFAYRLGNFGEAEGTFTEEHWLQIPGALAFSLSGSSPNPSQGMMSVSFMLPIRASAALDLIDIRGRIVAHRDLSTLEPGAHVVDLGGESQLASGMYLLKLSQGARSEIRKVAIVR